MRKLLTLFSALFVLVTISSAQGLTIGATGGLTVVTGPDSYTNDISEGGAGFKSAPHFGVKGRLSLPLIPISITGQVLYSKFSADGSLMINNVSTNYETEQSLLIFGVGAEYDFVPGPVSPYLGLDIFYSKWGDYTATSTIGGVTNENTASGNSRTGIGIGGGVQIGIIPLIDIDVSAKYNINNLIGKEDGEDTFSTLNLSASVFFGF